MRELERLNPGINSNSLRSDRGSREVAFAPHARLLIAAVIAFATTETRTRPFRPRCEAFYRRQRLERERCLDGGNAHARSNDSASINEEETVIVDPRYLKHDDT